MTVCTLSLSYTLVFFVVFFSGPETSLEDPSKIHAALCCQRHNVHSLSPLDLRSILVHIIGRKGWGGGRRS